MMAREASETGARLDEQRAEMLLDKDYLEETLKRTEQPGQTRWGSAFRWGGRTTDDALSEGRRVLQLDAPSQMLGTAVAIGSIVLPGPDDAVMAGLLAAKGYRLSRAGKLVKSLGSEVSEAEAKALFTEYQSEKSLFEGGGSVFGRNSNLLPGSSEHKALRWKEYQTRGGKWGEDQWSKVYDQNMVRATEANKVVDGYHSTLGWGEREIEVQVDGLTRRLDIADLATKRAVEVKSGSIYLTEEIRSELARDAALRNKYGWDIQWHFEGSASKPLRAELDRLKIPYTGGA
jgi:hypothetical protein